MGPDFPRYNRMLPAHKGFRGRLIRVRSSQYFHNLFLVLFAAVCIFMVIKPQAPQKALLVFYVAAVVMTLAEAKGWHKACWFVILIVLVVLENRAINSDKSAEIAAQAVARQEDRESFKAILNQQNDSFAKLLDQEKSNLGNILAGC